MVRRATARTCRAALIALAATCLSLSLAAQWPAPESIDLDAVYRIKEEGLQRSKVMETASYLTDVYGPRLTGSPNFRDAASWAQKTLGEWGLAHVHMESWPFGRAWQNQRFVALAVSPQAYPLLGAPVAWTASSCSRRRFGRFLPVSNRSAEGSLTAISWTCRSSPQLGAAEALPREGAVSRSS